MKGILTALFLAAASLPASAQRIYPHEPVEFFLAPKGGPLALCTQLDPCTLQRAVDRATKEYDFGGTSCPALRFAPGTYDLNPFVVINKEVLGCGEALGSDISSNQYIQGPWLKLIGSNVNDVVLTCSFRCFRQFEGLVYITGVTLKSFIGIAAMGYETLGKRAVTMFGDIRFTDFDDKMSQPLGAGNGGVQYFAGKIIPDTHGATLWACSEHGRFTFLTSAELVLNGSRIYTYWVAASSGCIVDTYDLPLKITGPGATMPQYGTPHVCSENAILTLGFVSPGVGFDFPGSQPSLTSSGCVFNGKQGQ